MVTIDKVNSIDTDGKKSNLNNAILGMFMKNLQKEL